MFMYAAVLSCAVPSTSQRYAADWLGPVSGLSLEASGVIGSESVLPVQAECVTWPSCGDIAVRTSEHFQGRLFRLSRNARA